MKSPSVKTVRCAIYTRVSTEHGLDQEFNSLDAQYDAASAYIKSQAHAGWALIRSRYEPPERPASPNPASNLCSRRLSRQRGPRPSTPASLQCCGRQRAQQSLRSWLLRIGSSIRCAAFSPVSSAGNSVSTLFQSKQTRGEYIASRTAKLRPPPWTRLNRRPDAMQRKHRNGRPSTKMSLEHEIAHLRGLDLKGLRSRWQSIFQRSAPAHLTRHLLLAVIAYRIQADRFGDLDHETRQVLDRTVAKEARPVTSARLASFDQSQAAPSRPRSQPHNL